MSEKIGEIFTLDEVAKYLKVGKRTIYRLVAEKKIPAFKVGGAWRLSLVPHPQQEGPQTPLSLGERGRG